MNFFRQVSKSTDLMLGMAARLGADLGAEITHDPLQGANQVRSMALRCSACPHQQGCAALQQQCDHLDAAPDYCRNKVFLDHVAHA
ncbi:DUF6455 family protein [Antarcticimicrobium sediminis]|uniref:Adenylosuccinate lyase n=1 Tax=Antarcticimicrobium sediminis TaxID=2546227 RepID=A0A4R5EZ68_9RHOB|nr:DUF6455 family protein [Antarcticimicrobium sediminis]TDE40262.1 adenylosuccinate lyase [Antarcticimicrobium sediminis]